MKPATAIAHSNIALIKYWGKRPSVAPSLNLPATGSLSLTLDRLWTETRLEPAAADVFALDGVVQEGKPAARVWAQLDRLWAVGHDGQRPTAAVHSTNHLPTAAGLASSASGFAALTVAAAHAYGLGLDRVSLSAHARMGSGSAARSLFGGFVRLDRGERDDGRDCVARPIEGADGWPLELVVVQTTRGPKAIGSTEGMEASRLTSPYYAPWVETSPADLDAAEAALRARDLPRLGELVEHSCFKMHACMLATRPPLLYWNAITLAVIERVWQARREGVLGYVTIDAGPHVKVLCEPAAANAIAERCRDVPGVEAIAICRPGPEASVRGGAS